MTRHAKGTFTVKLTPQDDGGDDPRLGRMLLDKRFEGDLDASSYGQMLSARSTVSGSAGYVAIEKVTGTLHGKAGGFVLQHSGTMQGGTASLSLAVVPDSATGELVGLAGTMQIIIVDGAHSYQMDYQLD